MAESVFRITFKVFVCFEPVNVFVPRWISKTVNLVCQVNVGLTLIYMHRRDVFCPF